MILMGDYTTIPDPDVIQDLTIFNISSPITGYNVLSIMPPYTLDFTFDNTFDKVYYEYLIANDQIFIQFMNIIMNEYYGGNTYILISKGPSYDYINESLCKLIQVRYGIIVQYINDIEDYSMLRYDTDVSFSVFGMEALVQDKERYALLYAEMTGMGEEDLPEEV